MAAVDEAKYLRLCARIRRKRPIGGDLRVLPFLGFSAAESGPDGTNWDYKLPGGRFSGRDERWHGGITWGTDGRRNSFLEKGFRAVGPSRIAGFEQSHQIRVRRRVDRALASFRPHRRRIRPL